MKPSTYISVSVALTAAAVSVTVPVDVGDCGAWLIRTDGGVVNIPPPPPVPMPPVEPGSQSHAFHPHEGEHCWVHMQLPPVLLSVTVLVSPSAHSAPHCPRVQLNSYWSRLHEQSVLQNPAASRIPNSLPWHVLCCWLHRWLSLLYGSSHCSPVSTIPSPQPAHLTVMFFCSGATGLHLALSKI